MSPAGLEPTISAGERPQTYALDRAATTTDSVMASRTSNQAWLKGLDAGTYCK